jgi:hypothetical protein
MTFCVQAFATFLSKSFRLFGAALAAAAFQGGCAPHYESGGPTLPAPTLPAPVAVIAPHLGGAESATTVSVVETTPLEVVGAAPTGPRSEPLSCGLFNPMPGSFTAGYAADTGLDLAGMKSPVFAIASGEVVYAEAGHTRWTGPGDTDLAILIELDEPIPHADGKITHVWYAHMFELAFEQAGTERVRRRVAGGEYLGLSGRANRMWHLHLGLLLDGDTSQRDGAFLLEDGVRDVLCDLRHKQRLPL